MINFALPGSALWFGQTEWARPGSPNGYLWDEDEDFPRKFLAYCRECALINQSMRSQLCVFWNVEGERWNGVNNEHPQPEWAYVGNPRHTPPCLTTNLLRDGIGEFLGRGVRVFATVRSSEVWVDPWGRPRRLYNTNHRTRLSEIFDWMESVGISGAYYDSNAGQAARRLWAHNRIRANAKLLTPPLVPAETVLQALADVRLGPALNPWGGGGFDVFGEFGDEGYDVNGIGIWADARLGDVRFHAGGDTTVPDGRAMQQAYRKRHPLAWRVLAGLDEYTPDGLPNPAAVEARMPEYREAMAVGGAVMLFPGQVPIDRPEWGGTWRVYDFYAELHGWPKREARLGGVAAAAAPGGGDDGRRVIGFPLKDLSLTLQPRESFPYQEAMK